MRMDALLRGADWAEMGTSSTSGVEAVAVSANKTPPERGSRRLRGKDSNLDYLIQSQASYH
jgi:hypothetical protein